ncbi:transposase [Micromonospora sp. NBC_01740]|uniref:transposase n=1 Tax=Micromonospora sp. NBC_01740 TaxID=2975986 RepID=UPI002E155D07
MAICRAEAIRLARRIRALDAELAANHTALHQTVTAQAPQLLALPGVGAIVAATVLLAWSHPGRVRSEAAFAALAGASPLPALSGNTTATGSTAAATDASTERSTPSRWSAWATMREPATTSPAAPAKDAPNARSCAASSATSAGNSSGP